MVMILSQSLDKQGADPVACRTFNPEPHTPKKMSQGPTLFSCGIMENDRWRDLDRKCPLQIDQPSASIWECLPDKCQDGALWHREAATTCAVTNLIKDLSLSDHNGHPSAPPSKRQCRSLSFSDEMASCRTSWRPLGSKVWTPVEKRRCYSGGSVQRYSNGFSTMQRSSSFSLPSRANMLSSPYDPVGLHPRPGGLPGPGVPGPATCGQAGDLWGPAASPVGGGRLDMQRSLSCSHEQFSFVEYCPPSASSTPASTPEPARRSGGLARSRSQPCVLNDKKVGIKRRRPEEAQEQRPSLDLAKMAQNCQTFSSLSCLNTGTEDRSAHSPFALHTRSWAALHSASSAGGRTPAGTPVPEPLPSSLDDPLACREEPCCEEPGTAWRDRRTRSSPCSLDGELDIEQIENN
ncbi:protein FAM53B [Bubalus kerabau]|uniref:protein FAM53B n=1 Tax=Bubalus bubalis TaxID=89462 RepID=UPI00042CB55F|nr:protein FAM53B [Bubalus bubalis]XP_025130220.1 protein FAM53B [Bubalus bubalis]XP_055416956.1 protein FAM53B [Bubalus carabanensis]